MPAILYYDFKNKVDMDAYKLHRYYNDIKPARSMPLAYDTWLSHFDDLYFERLEEQLNVAKELGLEYFTIDAGWFFKPRAWWNSVGDWEEATDCSMCGRMKEFADLVRANGLKFGLWFEIERAGVESKSLTEHPEHYLMENGYGFVNFGRPETVDYIYKKLEDNIIKYGIEYIKFDYNAELTYDPTNHSFVEFFKGYHEFLHRINREHPEVYLENCASGGLRMSLASLEGFDSFWISDNHSLYTQLEIFKNTLIRMPSRALETWLTIATFKNYTPTYEGEPTEKIIASGNHDWTFADKYWQEGNKYLPMLADLSGGDPHFSYIEYDDVIVAMVDNSTNTVTKETVDKFFALYEKNKPIILSLHVPLYAEGIYQKGIEKEGKSYTMGGKALNGDDPQVKRLYEEVCLNEDTPVIAVLSGHVHFEWQENFPNGVPQYTTLVGFSSGCSFIKLKPQ
jgi:hypothetical protein